MTFAKEFAAAWSPMKAVRNRRRFSNEGAAGEHKSPGCIVDFPSDYSMDDHSEDTENDDEEAMLEAISIDTSIVKQLSLEPTDGEDATQNITPILISNRQPKKSLKVLPTLDEKSYFDCPSSPASSLINSTIDVSNTSPVGTVSSGLKPKKKAPVVLKPGRKERVKELAEKATHAAATGDEEEAITVYKKAFRLADMEVTKLKDQLDKSHEKHPATLRSIQTRIQEDMLEVVLLAGNIKTAMTILFERQGLYEEAIETCKDAKSIYKKQRKRTPSKTETGETSPGGTSAESTTDSDSEQGVIWYVKCSNIDKLYRDSCCFLERIKKAQSSFEDRRKMLEDILILRQEIAMTFDAKEKKRLYAKVEHMAKHALNKERSDLGQMHPQVADTMQLLSALALEQQDTKPGSRDTAIQYLLRGLEINQNSLGKKHPRTGQDLLHMARLYQQPVVLGVARSVSIVRQDEDRAVEYFQQAVEVYKHVKNGHDTVASTLNDLAVIQVARQNFPKALELLREARASYESGVNEDSDSLDDGNKDVAIDIVQVWRNMGECHMNLRQFEQAMECFVTALDCQREARRKHDSVSETDLESVGDEKSFLVHLMQMINDESIADTLRRLGKAFVAAGRFKEGMVVYREAAQIHRAAVSEAGTIIANGSASPELPAKQDQLANTFFCIAELCEATGDLETSVKVYNESMQLRISSDSHRPEARRCNMVHCAMCLVGIANVHLKKGEFVPAHKLYNNALLFCEAQGLPYNHAIVSMIESKKGAAEKRIAGDPNRDFELLRLEEQAESERKRGEFGKAISTLSEVLTIRQASTRRLKAAGMNTAKEMAATVRLLHQFGHVFSAKGDEEKAQRAHSDAVRLYKQSTAGQAPSKEPNPVPSWKTSD